MSFDPSLYINKKNHWEQLRNYIISNYGLDAGLNPDQTVKKYIQSKAKSIILNVDEYGSFDKAIRNYINNSTIQLKNHNVYRLLFVLEIHDIDEILSFCRNTLHQNELSARSLEDFIVLCCLKLRINYNDYLKIRCKYNDPISLIRNAPERLAYGGTGRFLDDIINLINSQDDMDTYIKEHISDFAKTRNTPYLYMYDHINWDVWTKTEWISFFKIFPNDAPEDYQSYTDDDWSKYINEYINGDYGITNQLMKDLIIYCCTNCWLDSDQIDQDQLEKYYSHMSKKREGDTLKKYYLRMFSLCEDGLSEQQINVLAGGSCFSDTFLTYDKYKELYSRQLKDDISQGTFLLSYILKYDPDKGDYRYGDLYTLDDDLSEYACDLFNPKISIEKQFQFINMLMAVAGFPALSDNIPFNKLFMTTYRDVLSSTTCDDFDAIKGSFIKELCSRLKQIADYILSSKQ